MPHPLLTCSDECFDAAAPAADLLLRLMAKGRAGLMWNMNTMHFAFEGEHYPMTGDWPAIIEAIGWDKARAALTEGEGK